MLIFAVRSYLTRFNVGVHPVGTLTENRACGLVHFNLIHTTCIRYMYLYFFFRELCLRVGMFLCVCILLMGFSLFLSLFDLSFFLSFFLSSSWDLSFCSYLIVGFFSVSILILIFLSFSLSFLFFSFSMGKGFWWQREWKLNQKTIIKLLFFISI